MPEMIVSESMVVCMMGSLYITVRQEMLASEQLTWCGLWCIGIPTRIVPIG